MSARWQEVADPDYRADIDTSMPPSTPAPGCPLVVAVVWAGLGALYLAGHVIAALLGVN